MQDKIQEDFFELFLLQKYNKYNEQYSYHFFSFLFTFGVD
jgi:hypothetical protein